MTCGIYAIINKTNGHQYIGSSADIEKRWRTHDALLRFGKHHSIYLQRAWDLYGEDNFKFDLLTECNEDQLLILEQKTIDNVSPVYNMCPVAGSVRGIKRSVKTRQRMSEAFKGNPNFLGHYPSNETRQKLSEARKGKTLSAETREKISKANKGRKHTLEARLNMSAAQIGNGHPGHKCSPEARKNMSKARIGNKCAVGHHYHATDETRKKLSEAAKKYYQSLKNEHING